MHFLLLFCLTLIVRSTYQTSSSLGSVELDEITFDKITNRFQASLVKFDVAFPYGDKHDAFVALAKDAKDVDELLVAEVGVKDYGEKENEQLANKYGATKDNFPVVKLFIKGRKEPVTFDESSGFTSDELRRFVRENSGLHLSLPGCIKEMDKIAISFMKAKGEERKQVFKVANEAQKGLAEKDVPMGKVYITIMDKIIEKGNEFIKLENERVKKLLNSKVSDEKKQALKHRLNVLQSFELFDIKQKEFKDDL